MARSDPLAALLILDLATLALAVLVAWLIVRSRHKNPRRTRRTDDRY